MKQPVFTISITGSGTSEQLLKKLTAMVEILQIATTIEAEGTVGVDSAFFQDDILCTKLSRNDE